MNSTQPLCPKPFAPMRLALVAAASTLFAGCATMPAPHAASTASTTPSAPTAPAVAAPASALAPAAPEPVASRPSSANASVAGQARSFSTQLATYTAVTYDTLPGWGRDDFAETWPAFLGSCKVLTGRGAEWRQICQRALVVDAKSSPAIRSFFEREFSAYQIRDDDRRPDGVVTGYFEPEIAGSRNYAPPHIYPVYGPDRKSVV
jgi:membrane-bound lytic murein transglycosylase A